MSSSNRLPPRPSLQIDTNDLRPERGVVREYISARDMVFRWDVLEVHELTTSLVALHFLDALVDRMSFTIAELQVDGGSGFAVELSWPNSTRRSRVFALHAAVALSTAQSSAPIALTTKNFIR